MEKIFNHKQPLTFGDFIIHKAQALKPFKLFNALKWAYIIICKIQNLNLRCDFTRYIADFTDFRVGKVKNWFVAYHPSLGFG